MVERCLCCGEILPEGQQVCKNCLVAAKEMEIKPKRKKHWTTVLKDVWYNFLCGWLVGMVVLGHLLIGLLVVIFMTDGDVSSLWCVLCLLALSMLVTFCAFRWMGKVGK